MTTARIESFDLPSRRVLAELPVRVVVFLRATGTQAYVRSALRHGGFGADDHREGWALLSATCAFDAASLDPEEDRPAREALAEIHAYVSTHFPRLEATLERLHPEHVQVLFSGLEWGAPASAALALGTLLERIDALGKKARELIQTLERRAFGKDERARLRVLLDCARSAPAPSATAPLTAPRDRELLALYRWFRDWSTTARACIKRKDVLIALGLLKRASGDEG